jgi:hypothetical protein
MTTQHEDEFPVDFANAQPPAAAPPTARASDNQTVTHPANTTDAATTYDDAAGDCAKPVLFSPQLPPKQAQRGGAPRFNFNRLRGGERSRLPLRKAGRGEGHLIGEINRWRRDQEAELVAKAGPISGMQEARLVSACQWELCRRRRNRLAAAAKTDAERANHEEAAAANSERRDKCLELAGLAKVGDHGRGGNAWAAANGSALPATLLSEIDADTTTNGAAEVDHQHDEVTNG